MKNIIYLLGILLLVISCRDEELKGDSPSQRARHSIESLKTELTEAPYGWKVIYFPKTDSLLFSDKEDVIERDPAFRSKYGYGGHYFTMKFGTDGTVTMLTDTDDTTISEPKKSEYSIKQNTFTQLSFTTPSYLNKLLNEQFAGSPDWLYVGKNWEGNLVFKTASYIEPAREYIVFEKIEKEEDFSNFVQASYDNRMFFDNLSNPQITIRQGSKIFFQSDVIMKTPFVQNFINEIQYKRYYLFRFGKKLNPDPNRIDPLESNGLGSGYVGTEQGITFYSGIRYSSTYIFYDFERQGNKFVCELVKVYDPILKKYRMMSKHLAPNNAEFTGFIAEIQ